jgi:L-2,4-diaminobutyrate transaminase
VVSGFGRLGSYWGSQALGLEPDLITAAKGITSGYFPMSVCFVSAKVWDVVERGSETAGVFGHGYTYSAHPVGAAAALATLQAIDDDKVVENVADLAPYLHERLHKAVGDHELVGNVRGRGFMVGIELMADRAKKTPFAPELRTGRKVLKAALDRGLITRALGDTLVFAPPLVFTKENIDELVDTFTASLDAVAQERP